MIGVRLLVAALVALSLSASLAQAGSESRGASGAPVPSLEPAQTEALWRSLVTRQPRDLRAQAACRPLRAVFYAASDWLRLATKLAATASPCAEYYISVPPLVADKTTFRRDQAWRIRALGRNFHALAEIHFATWERWVASTGSSWHTAGVTARRRMAEAGYDVALGDSWALNELTSAVRRGDGTARTNIREFLRGLYEGEGRAAKGAVLVIGFGQRTGDVSAYQRTLQSWLSDSAFWTDMATYVSDWSQEVYGDIRAHAAPGVPLSVRREYLNDYLQHKLVLAAAGPPEIEPARAFLRAAYSPLANGAWPRETAWGWTMVPHEQMAAYISAQVNAMRYFSATTAQPSDHWGFAWAPRNTTGLTPGDFANQTGALLERLAAAIRDSGDASDPENPGSGACGPGETLCALDLPEARHNEAWRSFRAWAQSALAIGGVPASLTAGVASPPLQLSWTAAGAIPVTVTLRSSSPAGTFSTSSVGPWATTMSLSVLPGSAVTFYYRDTRAGAATLTATGPGASSATQNVTVVAGPVARVTVTPATFTVKARGQRRIAAAATDAFGNASTAAVAWRVSPAALGTVAPGPVGAATFTAGRVLGSGRIDASVGTVAASASVAVVPANLHISSVRLTPSRRGFRALVSIVDGARRPISKARLTLVVEQDGRRVFRGQALTGSGGKALFRVRAGRGCFRVVLTRATAQGFRWTGASPRRSICLR